MPTATTKITFYSFNNPHHSSYLDIEFKENTGLFSLRKIDDDYRSIYELQIDDTTKFGFVYQEDADQAIQDLITSINLHILSGAAVRQISRIERPVMSYTNEEKEKYDIKDISAHIKTKNKQPLREDSVYKTFRKVSELDRSHVIPRSSVFMSSESHESARPPSLERYIGDLSSPNITNANIRKSLLAYDGAIEAFDKSVQHLLLFVSLETAADVEGDDLRSDDLQEAISDVAQIDAEYIKQWRDIYHRQKHVDRTPEEVRKSVSGLTSRGLNLKGMRKAAMNSIHSALPKASCNDSF